MGEDQKNAQTAGYSWKPFAFGRVELKAGEYSFVPSAGRKAEITAYRGYEPILVIPDMINDLFQVTQIGEYAFRDREYSTQIFVPEHVTSIGDGAFSGCSAAEAIVLPASVTRIGRRAFEGCKRLERMEIPRALGRLGEDAFKGCQSICLLVYEGSLAADYARRKHIPYHLLCDDFEYILLEDGTAVILDYRGGKAEVHIPETICGHTVSAVDKKVSLGFYTSRVIMPKGVVETDMNAQGALRR